MTGLDPAFRSQAWAQDQRMRSIEMENVGLENLGRGIQQGAQSILESRRYRENKELIERQFAEEQRNNEVERHERMLRAQETSQRIAAMQQLDQAEVGRQAVRTAKLQNDAIELSNEKLRAENAQGMTDYDEMANRELMEYTARLGPLVTGIEADVSGKMVPLSPKRRAEIEAHQARRDEVQFEREMAQEMVQAEASIRRAEIAAARAMSPGASGTNFNATLKGLMSSIEQLDAMDSAAMVGSKATEAERAASQQKRAEIAQRKAKLIDALIRISASRAKELPDSPEQAAGNAPAAPRDVNSIVNSTAQSVYDALNQAAGR